jgi:SAM-dependent methyltransferase
MSYAPHVFDRSGLAASSDLQTPEYQQYYCEFDKKRLDFLHREEVIRRRSDDKPLDHRSVWSRIWEQPYTYYHLEKLRSATPKDTVLKVVDLGSGFTVFSFLVAQLGYHVDCLDIDPVCGQNIVRVAAAVDHRPGDVNFHLISDASYPYADGTVDAVYCTSVLEHIPDFQTTIREVARVLKPNGVFILTIDLDLCGFMEIGVTEYQNLRKYLSEHFSIMEPELAIHPMDMLQPRNSPFPRYTFSTWAKWKYHTKDFFRPFFGRKRRGGLPNLTVWGGVLTKLAVGQQESVATTD